MIDIDIKNWRKDKDYCKKIISDTGLTQQQLADRLGMNRVMINRYYNGASVIPYPLQVCIEIIGGSYDKK